MNSLKNVLLVAFVSGVLAVAVFAAPPNFPRLDGVVSAPLTSDPVRKNTTGLGTTIDDLLDTDLTSGEQVDSATQLITVTNLDTTGRVCVGSVAYSGTGTACIDKCGTAANWATATVMNCTANSAHMGSVIPAGQSRDFRYDGTRCVCMVASEASVEVQAERIIR